MAAWNYSVSLTGWRRYRAFRDVCESHRTHGKQRHVCATPLVFRERNKVILGQRLLELRRAAVAAGGAHQLLLLKTAHWTPALKNRTSLPELLPDRPHSPRVICI